VPESGLSEEAFNEIKNTFGYSSKEINDIIEE
jgi:hypothetical protein